MPCRWRGAAISPSCHELARFHAVGNAVLVPYQIRDWEGQTLLLGICESKEEGDQVLKGLPDAILKK